YNIKDDAPRGATWEGNSEWLPNGDRRVFNDFLHNSKNCPNCGDRFKTAGRVMNNPCTYAAWAFVSGIIGTAAVPAAAAYAGGGAAAGGASLLGRALMRLTVYAFREMWVPSSMLMEAARRACNAMSN